MRVYEYICRAAICTARLSYVPMRVTHTPHARQVGNKTDLAAQRKVSLPFSLFLSLSLNACACVLYQRGGVWDGLGDNPVLQIKGHARTTARGRSQSKA